MARTPERTGVLVIRAWLEDENAELRKLPLDDSIPESPPSFRESRDGVKSQRRDAGLQATKPPGA